MRRRFVHSLIGLTLISVIAAGFAVSRGSEQGTATPPNVGQARPKKLREIALERDVEVDGPSGCEDPAELSLAHLSASSNAIVSGRIVSHKSYFDESGAPIERGDYITTEYHIEVLQVLKDRTLENPPPKEKTPPAPLATPMKIARNGGVVYVNGHRASVKVTGYDELVPGMQYVFFLNWSADYKAYILTGCLLGVVIVNHDLSLRSLGSSPKLTADLRDKNLRALTKWIK